VDAGGSRSREEILRGVDDTLRTAELGLKDFLRGRPRERRLPGLRNLVVFGRAVTNGLQNLRSVEPEFDAWYRPYVEEMESDPLMRYFYELRTRILKEANLGVYQGFEISGEEGALPPLELLGTPPPGAVKGFVSSHGSGWVVRLPDGTEEEFYVDLPLEGVEVSHFLTDQPDSHLDSTLPPNSTAEQLSESYVAYLRRMFEDAKQRFRKAKEGPARRGAR